ncbi:hypothetical protein Taro_025465, partial [Colocasia esculenta]|nr:hypothetical protein [Colocasia esculenta]
MSFMNQRGHCFLGRSGNSVSGNPGATSGDETVPYNSLSWCKTWLGPKVNITQAPQTEHDGSDVQTVLSVEHHKDKDLISNMTRTPQVKYITYYEDAESIPGKRTAIWELDKASHRNIVRSPVLMRELWLQMWHDIHPDARSKFVTKGMYLEMFTSDKAAARRSHIQAAPRAANRVPLLPASEPLPPRSRSLLLRVASSPASRRKAPRQSRVSTPV